MVAPPTRLGYSAERHPFDRILERESTLVERSTDHHRVGAELDQGIQVDRESPLLQRR